jgi:hypothetical protein
VSCERPADPLHGEDWVATLAQTYRVPVCT